jgi:hypothetical protein
MLMLFGAPAVKSAEEIELPTAAQAFAEGRAEYCS